MPNPSSYFSKRMDFLSTALSIFETADASDDIEVTVFKPLMMKQAIKVFPVMISRVKQDFVLRE
jgi:hypothetical protein